jgi:fatty-acyl-CoA synthase
VLDENGWLDTGDLGYTLDGHLVITGRAKDLIIFNGRNIWPQDLEWAVEELPGVRRGDVAAFSVEGNNDEEDVILLVQCRTTDAEARGALVRAVQGIVQRAAAFECKVKLIDPRACQTSPAPSRSRAKTNYMSGVYGPPVPDQPGPSSRAPAPAAPAG